MLPALTVAGYPELAHAAGIPSPEHYCNPGGQCLQHGTHRHTLRSFPYVWATCLPTVALLLSPAAQVEVPAVAMEDPQPLLTSAADMRLPGEVY